MQTASMSVSDKMASLVGKLQENIYEEIDGPTYSNGLQARLVISSLDPEFQGKVKAELQLIDPAGFPVHYSEPNESLYGKWVAMCEGMKYLLTVE